MGLPRYLNNKYVSMSRYDKGRFSNSLVFKKSVLQMTDLEWFASIKYTFKKYYFNDKPSRCVKFDNWNKFRPYCCDVDCNKVLFKGISDFEIYRYGGEWYFREIEKHYNVAMKLYIKYQTIVNEKNRTLRISARKKAKLMVKVFTKTYNQRNFPPLLRTIIFERDNFTCQNCGRTLADLIKNGLHLEVDHVVAWVDGGQTTYDNGQTLCNECNLAKHHFKKYKQVLTTVSNCN